MRKKARANIRTRVANSAIRKEVRNGRDVIVVPSATLPDDVVMHRILYPASEIAATFEGLDRTPAPAGHPMRENAFISARDPEAINGYWVGAWNENVRQENGRVHLDKVIDVETAGQTERGRAVLAAIEAGEPIHTSVAVLLEKEPANNSEYDNIARNLVFDHDAILLDEPGAATPADGVGIFVNSAGESETVELLQDDLPEGALEFAADVLVDAAEFSKRDRERRTMRDWLKNALQAVISGQSGGELTANSEGEGSVMDEETKAEIKAQVEANSASVTEAVTEALKPVTERLEALEANAKGAEEAEKARLVETAVNSGHFTQDEAAGLDLPALRLVVNKLGTPSAAAPANGRPFEPNSAGADPFEGYDMNAALDAANKGGSRHAG